MRNLVTFILPPNQSHDVVVMPEMRPMEQPTVATFRKTGLVMEQLSNTLVRVTNSTGLPMPIAFAVIDRRLPAWIGVVKQLMGGT